MKVSVSRNAISIAKENANARANALENARATDTEKESPTCCAKNKIENKHFLPRRSPETRKLRELGLCS